MSKLWKWITRPFTKHEHRFAIEDLRMVNPDSDGADRVEWPCADCGHVFAAHCGLDISPKHGFTFRRGQGKSCTPPGG